MIGYGNNQSYYDNLFKLALKEFENQNFVKSLEYLMEVKIYAKENNLSNNMQISVITNMGIVYAEILDYEKAMECFLEANQLISGTSNTEKEIGILNNIAMLHILINNLDKAAEYLSKAYEMTVELKNNSRTRLLILNNMCLISNKKGDLEQTKKYLDIAMEIAKNNPQYSIEIITIKYVKAEYFYLKKEYDLAEQLTLDILNQELTQELEVDYLLLLSKIYYQKNNCSKAISFAEDALKKNSKLLIVIEIYEHLSNLYRTMDSNSLALQYKDSIIVKKDSLLKLNNASQILRGQIQFDLNNLEKKLLANKEKQKQERMFFMLIFIFFIVISLLFFYIRSIRNKRLRIVAELEKKEKLLLEQRLKEQETQALLEQERVNNEVKEKMLLKQQLKEQETLALLGQKMYKNEIELKNKQLVTKTLFQLSKNELIEEIIHELYHIPNQSQVSELQPVIQKLKSQLKEPAGSDWTGFLTYFEQTNPSFLFTLKEQHSDLTASDIRLSAYIYLNLDTKEISKLLNITPDHCNKKKQRLAEKLGVPTSKVYSYLANMV